MTNRIAYQGEPGSNSYQVCVEHYPGWEAVPCATFEEAFAMVESRDADLAMIPIENTLAGRVADIHHFLPNSRLYIIAEHFLRIRFHLMGIKGAKEHQLTTVRSHIHALGQCRGVVNELGLTTRVTGDTAGAAREIAELGDPTQAAFSPPMAAELYGLDVLRADVEDDHRNTTRFVVLSRNLEEAPRDNGPVITSFMFQARNIPASLYKALGGFATNGVNMIKLESYMDDHFTATKFLCEVEGHPDDPPLKRALEELRFFATQMRIFGIFPADEFRGL